MSLNLIHSDPPLAVENFNCISENWSNLNCTWDEPYNPVKTEYRLHYAEPGGRFRSVSLTLTTGLGITGNNIQLRIATLAISVSQSLSDNIIIWNNNDKKIYHIYEHMKQSCQFNRSQNESKSESHDNCSVRNLGFSRFFLYLFTVMIFENFKGLSLMPPIWLPFPAATP